MMSVETCARAMRGAATTRQPSSSARAAAPMHERSMAESSVGDWKALLRRLGRLDLHALERESARAIAGLQVDDTALSKSGNRATERHSHALVQSAGRIQHVVHELAVLRLRGRRGEHPHVAVE